MKTINKINYEQFAIDYLEGNLSGDLLFEMKEFLKNNSDIRKELEEMELFYLEADDHIVFEGKDTLLQSTSAKKSFSIRSLFWISGIAAFFILITGLFVINYTNDSPVNNIAHEKENNINKENNNNANIDENIIDSIKENLIKKEEIIAKKNIQKTNIIQAKIITNLPKENRIHNNNNNNNNPIAFSKSEKIIQQHGNQLERVIIPKQKEVDNPIAKQGDSEVENNIPQQKINMELKLLKLESVVFNDKEIILENNLTVVEPQEKSRLINMGLLPEKSNRKITLKTIREALIPEAFASRD